MDQVAFQAKEYILIFKVGFIELLKSYLEFLIPWPLTCGALDV